MVPKGWSDGRVGDLLSGLESGVSVNGEDRHLAHGEKGVLKVSAVSYGVFDENAAKAITSGEELKRAKTHPKKGQIIISRSNTEELVGASAYVEANCDHLYLSDKLWQTIPKPNSISDMKWLSYVLASEYSRYTLSNLASGTSGSMKNITKDELLGLKVSIPPLPEQRKIAKILSTWDKAINTTEKLIETSKQQTKALMQQLLTGKKRLVDPETGEKFEGEWEDIRFGDIASYIKGYTYKSHEYSEVPTGYGFFTLKSILRGGGYSKKGIKYLNEKVDDKFSVQEGDVVFAVTDLTRNAEVVGAPIIVPNLPYEKIFISMDLMKLEISSSIDKSFLFYLLKLRENRNFMRARASGSTVLHLDVKGSKKLPLYLPSSITEQKKIAQVLTTADKEIEILEAKLTHFKQEKKALMQQLLTGKRRVKIDTEEVA